MDTRLMTTANQQKLKREFAKQRLQFEKETTIWVKYNCPSCPGQQRRPAGKTVICPDCGYVMV